ncbi:MAG: hypothetical protein M3A24_02300 [Candidatus Rhabdochlamydia oedothoracis]|nr:hypothetical protein [Candidatus Rhabdochlamydia oedothoracis]
MSLVFPERMDSSGKIEYPSYTVAFDICQNNKKTTTLEKVQVCAQRSFQLVSIFFVSSKDALFKTLGGAGTSFKYTVLSYYGSWSQIPFPENAHLVVFKIVFWIFSMGWGIVTTTFRLFSERASPGHALFLKQFASDEIDVDHIKTEEIGLDASHVPEDIKVDTLKELFDKINFTDKAAPGYMAEGSRQEQNKIFSPEELRKNLNEFIHRVNTREAFIGTPSTHDVFQLMDFYQQIEDAVRLSIHKVRENVTDFEDKNKNKSGSFIYDELAEDKKCEYKNLLETQARVALDLAIAGGHCGARYMGEAMDVYYNIYNEEGISNDKDLQGTLIEILAKKREEIAKAEAQKLGLDDRTSDTTHQFTKYMGNMGRLLGIPGTKNIIEYLSQSIDTYQLLNDFFQKYTVDTIIKTIQEKIKTSQSFREKITDWIKDQIKDWNHEKYEDIDVIFKEIENIRNSPLKETILSSNFQKFQDLLLYLKGEKIDLPELKEGWDNFLQELFALDKVKENLNNALDRNNIKTSCSESTLRPELLQELQRTIASGNFTPISCDRYLPRFIENQKIQEMKKILPFAEDDSLLRLLKNETDLIGFIRDYQERVCQEDFLDFLGFGEILEKITSVSAEDLTGTKNLTYAENRAYQRLIEWILVSQKILKPQVESNQNEIGYINLAENQVKSYAETVHNASQEIEKRISLEKLLTLLRSKDENAEDVFAGIPDQGIRYREATKFKRDAVLTWVFNQSFQKNPDGITAAAEKVSKQVFYPKWKEVCLIQLPKVPAYTFCNTCFKVALIISAIFASIFSIYRAHERIGHLFVAKGIPFIINHVPVQIIRSGNAIIGVKEFIWRNHFTVIAIIWLTTKGIRRLPEIPYLSAAARSINLWVVHRRLTSSPQTIFWFALAKSTYSIGSVWNTSQEIGQRFRKISSNAEKERDIAYRQKSLEVWKSCQVALA